MQFPRVASTRRHLALAPCRRCPMAGTLPAGAPSHGASDEARAARHAARQAVLARTLEVEPEAATAA